MPRIHTRELALTHHAFKAGWHTSPWEWHFWTHLCLNRLIPLSLCAPIWAFRQLFSFIKSWMRLRLKLQNRVKWALNPGPERAFIPQFEVRLNGRDKLTQRRGQVDEGKSSCWALCISLRCVLTPWNIWVACCSHSTCPNRLPLKWSITFSNVVSDVFIIRESTHSKKQSFTGENQKSYICM